jgi:hypothetical protein
MQHPVARAAVSDDRVDFGPVIPRRRGKLVTDRTDRRHLPQIRETRPPGHGSREGIDHGDGRSRHTRTIECRTTTQLEHKTANNSSSPRSGQGTLATPAATTVGRRPTTNHHSVLTLSTY